MKFSACLKRVLARHYIEEQDTTGSVRLFQPNVMDLRLSGLSDDCIVVKLRTYKDRLLGDGEWKRLCDYILVDSSGSVSKVLLVELKRSLSVPSIRVASEQLRRSIPVLYYLKRVCDIENCCDNEGIVVRYLVLGKTAAYPLDKQPVRVRTRHRVLEYCGLNISSLVANEHERLELLWEQGG